MQSKNQVCGNSAKCCCRIQTQYCVNHDRCTRNRNRCTKSGFESSELLVQTSTCGSSSLTYSARSSGAGAGEHRSAALLPVPPVTGWSRTSDSGSGSSTAEARESPPVGSGSGPSAGDEAASGTHVLVSLLCRSANL